LSIITTVYVLLPSQFSYLYFFILFSTYLIEEVNPLQFYICFIGIRHISIPCFLELIKAYHYNSRILHFYQHKQ